MNIRPEVDLLMFPVEHIPPYCGPLEIAIDFGGFIVAVRKQLNVGNYKETLPFQWFIDGTVEYTVLSAAV